MRRSLFALKVSILTLALFFLFFFSIFFGAVDISPFDLFSREGESRSFASLVLCSIRLPRAILVLFSGFLLSLSGGIFQRFFGNPLAEPSILGITSGGVLGVIVRDNFITSAGVMSGAFAILQSRGLFAFLFSFAVGLLILALSTRFHGDDASLILTGCSLSVLLSSVSTLILMLERSPAREFYTWIFGNFSGKSWSEVALTVPVSVLTLIFMIALSPTLDLMITGAESAESLGVDTRKLRFSVLILSSLATSLSVSVGGAINFIGLIAPHLTRKLFSSETLSNLKLSLPTLLIGGILTLSSDLVARCFFRPAELPTGIITSIIGGVFFLFCVLQKRTHERG